MASAAENLVRFDASNYICSVLGGLQNDFFSRRHPETFWEDLIRVAAKQLVLPTLYSRLQALKWLENAPPEIAEFLRSVQELNFERNVRILAEVAAAAKLLNDIGIEPVVLKGVAYLITDVYEQNGTRFLSDIDFLVAEPNFESAFKVFADVGFKCYQTTRIQRVVYHAAPLSRSESVNIDLHRILGVSHCDSLLPAFEIEKDSVPYRLVDATVRIPSPEHLIMHHIIHSQIHHGHRERIWFSMRTMYDFLLLQRRFRGSIDWKFVERRFRQNGQYGVLAMYLLYMENELGVPSPIPIHLSCLNRLRWYRSNLMRTAPSLRFIDPIYMINSCGLHRATHLINILRVPGGQRYLIEKLWKKAFTAGCLRP